jgi:ABC-2 type transport system permease protein
LGAVGGAVLMFIVSGILDQVTALGGLRNLLPTHYQDAYTGFLTSPVQLDDMVKGSISALLYAAVFIGLAWWRFLRKDITS